MNASEPHSENKNMNQYVDQNTASVNHSLQKVAKGATIVFIGTIIGMLLALVGKIFFARFFSPSEYGVFSIGVVLFSIFSAIGTIGLQEGIPRQIAHYLGKKQTKNVKFVIGWSLVLSSIIGVLIAFIVFISSDIVAINIFNMPNLSFPLRIFSIAIPFYILIHILISIVRGFKRVKEKVYFLDITKNLLFPILLAPVILLSLSFEWGIVAYILSIIITCVVFVIYLIKNKIMYLKLPIKIKNISVGKELILFSFPLLIVTILNQVMSWTDTMMIGYFKTSDIVGLYNVASPLGRFISSALTSMLFIYTPIASELYAKSKNTEMKRNYAILTKWLCAATLPVTLIFVLFSKTVLNFFFGQEYIIAYSTLQILAIGFFLNNLMGPNGATLTAMGKTKFLMWATFIAACINVGLNVALIPLYGATGAALATIIAILSVNIIRSIKLYSISKIHSLEKNILKPIFLSSTLIFIIYFLTEKFLTITYWMLPLIFIFFILIYGISLLLTKSFDQEDIDVLLNIEKKTGLNLIKVKRLIKRFF